MRMTSSGIDQQTEEGEKKVLNSQLWHACAGPLVSLPPMGSHVVYYPQGHSEQVAASTNKEIDGHIPNYSNLPPQLICQLHDVTMHANVETDEVYAQMTLQPLTPQEQKDVYLLPAELGTASKQPTNYFCKTLTASDTSTHGGFSVPRRAAEKVFPPLDFTLQPPAQELIARDLHDNEWKFRHIFRGQPKRHLLTTGWSVFVSAKRLVAGDAVIFIWNENNQLFLGIRRACRPQTVMPSSVLSSDSMHLGLFAAAAHAASTYSRFTIFYNPRASPCEFVVPLAKYAKAVYHSRVSVGMRFRMLFETEESSVRRYMGTITGISDLDPVRWPNSHWRSVKVGWDESIAGERQPRVSLWEIEPLTTFPMYPSSFPPRLKRPWPSSFPSFPGTNGDMGMNSSLMWLQREVGNGCISSLNFQGYGLGLMPWNQPRVDSTLGLQPDIFQRMVSSALQDPRAEKRPNHSHLQFQQNDSASCPPAAMLHNQLFLQHAQSQQILGQNFQESQTVSRNQVRGQLLQQQLQNGHSCNDHQEQLPHFEQFKNEFSDQQRISKGISTMPSFGSSTLSQPTASGIISVTNSASTADLPPMNGLLNLYSQGGGSSQFALPDSNLFVSSTSLLSKRVAVEPHVADGAVDCSVPELDELGGSQTQALEFSSLLLPLPGTGRDLSVFQGIGDPQNNMLFGLNIKQNELTNIRNCGSDDDALSMPFACSSFPIATGTDFTPSSDLAATSCLDESGFLQSSENVDQTNEPSRTFVKVQKTGSFGRSLDISKFSSYYELRSELARLFGLESELEDSMRSGWQLVFVDHENDILLLGDDPWQEFVNNVWHIKILSPQEVQQMGKEGHGCLSNTNSTPMLQQSINGYDGFTGTQNSRIYNNRISSITSLDC